MFFYTDILLNISSRFFTILSLCILSIFGIISYIKKYFNPNVFNQCQTFIINQWKLLFYSTLVSLFLIFPLLVYNEIGLREFEFLGLYDKEFTTMYGLLKHLQNSVHLKQWNWTHGLTHPYSLNVSYWQQIINEIISNRTNSERKKIYNILKEWMLAINYDNTINFNHVAQWHYNIQQRLVIVQYLSNFPSNCQSLCYSKNYTEFIDFIESLTHFWKVTEDQKKAYSLWAGFFELLINVKLMHPNFQIHEFFKIFLHRDYNNISITINQLKIFLQTDIEQPFYNHYITRGYGPKFDWNVVRRDLYGVRWQSSLHNIQTNNWNQTPRVSLLFNICSHNEVVREAYLPEQWMHGGITNVHPLKYIYYAPKLR